MIADPIKDKFIEEVERTGIIAASCRAVGVARATVYRWREDKKYNARVEAALALARGDWCDLAESKLLTAVKNGEPWAVRYLLESNSDRYFKPRTAKVTPKETRVVHRMEFEVMERREELAKEKPLEVIT